MHPEIQKSTILQRVRSKYRSLYVPSKPYLWLQKEILQLSQNTNICSKKKAQQTLSRTNTCKWHRGAADKIKICPIIKPQPQRKWHCPCLGLLAKVHFYRQSTQLQSRMQDSQADNSLCCH